MVKLKDIKNFQKAEKLLEKSKNIVIGNLTYESLELASTIKKNYPEKNVSIIDFNQKENYVSKDMNKYNFKEMIKPFKE